MSENNENKLVPRLRFPEFKDSGEWEEIILMQVANYENGKAHEQDIDDSGNFIVVNSKFISSDGEVKKFTNTAFCPSQKGDILMVLSDVPNGKAIAKCFLVEENNRYTVNQRVCRITPRNLNSKILYYLLNRNSYFLAFDDGVKQTNLRNEDVLNCPLLIPNDPQEQQKIAACLSSLDDVITAESKKLEVLKEHKKGLLQNLFPQEGETVPKLRFKEFENSGEWVSDILKNVFTIFQGFAFSSNDSVNDGVRWLKIADVGIQQMNHLSPSYLPYEFKDKYENFLIKEGDYVIALTRPILNKKLKISKVDNTLHNSLLNQRVGKLVSNKCIDFVYYLVQTSNLISRIEQNIAGSEPPNLSAQQIENIEVFIPSTKKEQQKIAACLSSIDDLINAQSQKIETLKLHKKGLLQGLFPDVNEHNG